ncbi:MAG TPA: oligosaccharide flippase family protein, partial [Chitinophagales bacterium]|nr:oligosaccharide flippase family protein [Chitinophagales bacterium]
MTLKYKFTPKKYQFKVLALTLDNLLCMTSVGLLQKLMRQTAVYGLSSIVARLLNYLLVPLYTRLLSPDEYGIVTEMYSYVAFLIVLYTYGMETAFFNTLRSEEENKYTIYSTSFWSLLLSTVVFSTILCVLSQPIAELLHYPQQAHFVRYIALILALDTLATLPFAWLRYEEKALRFAIIRLITIGANIGLNIFFLVLCPKYADSVAWIKAIYSPQMGVGYIFLSNLISSALCLLLLLPELLAVRWEWNKALWRTMVWYGLPLVVVGLAGSINEVLDRLLLKHLLPYDTARNLAELGIYGACYKLSILMTLFTQAYRFAVEPLFFKEAGQKDSPNFY